jgi:hypothetical protein
LDAYEVFDACSSQWRIVTGTAGVFYQGIDAAALAAIMEMLGIEDRRQCLQQVRMIEAGALEIINKH